MLALTWAVRVHEDPAWPSDLPEIAQVHQARATLDGAPATAARRVIAQAVEAGLLTAQPETSAA